MTYFSIFYSNLLFFDPKIIFGINSLKEKEALELLVDSISSGIYNDLNSGTSINAVVITKDGFTQKVFPVEEKTQR